MRGTDPDGPSGDGRRDAVTELTEHILGEQPLYTAAEVAARAGISHDQGRRLWRALGFPDTGGTRAYTATDEVALSTLVRTVHSGLMDFDVALSLTRALGQTMTRLADWEVGALTQRALELAGDGGTLEAQEAQQRIASTERIVDELGPAFEEMMIYAWRRHLAAAVARMGAVIDTTDAEIDSHDLTIGFADIVGFTALSNELSRPRIGDLVELFELRCSDVVAAAGGRVIKSIGDSVLFVNDDPVAALDTADGIIAVVGRDARMPDVRVGLACGPVVMRQGDVFGPPVNLAARLTGVARRNRIIVDAELASRLPVDQFETRALPARPLRGFGLVEPMAVWRL